jgi:hypothetical protein
MHRRFRTAVAASSLLAVLIAAPAYAASIQTSAFGETVSLNPQPLPPREGFMSLSLGDVVSLNPQPLPPRLVRRKVHIGLGDAVSLNPQPLPPKVFGVLVLR